MKRSLYAVVSPLVVLAGIYWMKDITAFLTVLTGSITGGFFGWLALMVGLPFLIVSLLRSIR